MGNKMAIILIYTLMIPVLLWSQLCEPLTLNKMQKKDKCYLIDSNIHNYTIESTLNSINPKDTAIASMIISNGDKDENYLKYFQEQGISIKKMGLDQFLSMPKDKIILTKEEQELNRKYRKLIKQSHDLAAKDKISNKINNQLEEKKYLNLLRKIETFRSLLFVMYPIYRYQNYTLVMYSVYIKSGYGSFNYKICN
jgi:hypothetical protein